MRQSQNVIVERRHHIMSLLAQNGSLRVSELCGLLSVSELTVRRDLDELAREGLLYRTHGGAALPADTYPNLPLYEDKHQIRHFQTFVDAGEAHAFPELTHCNLMRHDV